MQRFNPLPPKTQFSEDDKEQYQFKCPKCSRRPIFTSYKCYENTVARGCCNKCKDIGSHTCPRCNITTPYISKFAFKKAKANTKNCSKCKVIPDESIKFLYDEGKYAKLCPICGNPQYYPNKLRLMQAVRLGVWCKSCASKESAPRVRIKIKEWRDGLTPQERDRISHKKSVLMKKIWAAKTPEEKQTAYDHLNRVREEYLTNQTPEQRDKWLENMRIAFEKHRGANHWMNRPETMAKMHVSYIQYLGKNHWIHKPGVLKKILQTKKNDRLQKLADI